ncbi:PREDICTED: tyrosine aminotransferase isoform X2 [Polistes dominula]|uniref:Tyrosine aminotransferase n=1 Tax=Polistes dominula TaxID=743375 RepID=A0ABM1IGG0_POLDO|nr:PREDICTED: tyrosine aminotransferase isoform X2 [Polistes dominula]
MSGLNSRTRWEVRASHIAKRTHNPIRSIVENIVVEPNPKKRMIALSIGDPTTFGNLKPAKEVIEAVQESVASQMYNGYAPSTGYEKAREAVAEYSSTDFVKVEAKPERNWEIDLYDLETKIDESTAAIVINNPSNPCGSVFSRNHILDILNIATRYYLPIIADEIYEHMVFPGQTFHSLTSLPSEVPILLCSGLGKRFLVPGWRMGWIIIHDKQNVLEEEIRKGLQCLSQRIIGSNTLIQGALPAILKNTPQKFYDDVMSILFTHSKLCYNCIAKIPGLKPIMPGGAMYMMVFIDLSCFPEFNTDVDFVQRLLMEESVFCLPGQCFDYPSYMRLVITIPKDMLEEACKRIEEFCWRHHYKTSQISRKKSLIEN